VVEPPIVIVAVVGITVIPVTSVLTTVMLAVPVIVGAAVLVAVIVTGPPIATPVTTPVALTVAIAGLLDDQVTVLTFALAGKTVSVNCTVAPTVKFVVVAGAIVILVGN